MRLAKMPYVTLWSVRFSETKKLYREILGLKVVDENSDFIMFDTRASRLSFHRLSKGLRVDRRTVELHFEVNDVDEVYRSLLKRGVKFSGVPENKPWGTRAVSFRDPEGYEVEIMGPLR
jgi:catechol 2,3-dioxygenase-like lactoylglutathione lyase family enzyme